MNVYATSNAPAAIGPYSQATGLGSLVFLSGQIPLDPATGTLITGDIKAETEQVMKNLGAVLAEAGSSFEQVLRCTIYLTSMDDFQAVNEVYGTRFPGNKPARATVQVAGLPRGARVEIDAIAHRNA
jgi:2-iminobutanoate/2-iminopropanoate deaminase